MAIEYALTLAGSTPVERVAKRALPGLDERPTGTPPLLSADLWERYGFQVTVYAGRHGYLDAETDDGSLTWKPKTYVSVGFRMDKFADFQWSIPHMLTIVRRVMTGGGEDAMLTFNGDYALLTRFAGKLAKHRREDWWASYPAADSVIPG
ncbi:SitI3 family protein [Actinoplanes sp. NPDC049681]|uniref:SitI3 family protein n=1 Tax=Actinoplanes sp. NPDC049681 TaxID=3363905 RepID=UPI00379A1296